MLPSDARTVVRDPRWLCHRYDPTYDAFHYRHVHRQRHAEVPFLTDKDLGQDVAPVVLPRAEVRRLAERPAPLHFIFHSAFCGSTMLVRALDVPGSAMGLSEPMLLNDLVGWSRRGAERGRLAEVMADGLGQLARAFEPGEAVVLKPSNVFSSLAPAAMAMVPDARAVLLSAPLAVFLTSVARKGLDGRLWARELLEGLMTDGMVNLGFEPADYLRQTDLQSAAVAWLAQHALFQRLTSRFPDRVRAFNSEKLTQDSASAVAEVAGFLQLPQRNIVDYSTQPALSRDSKSGQPFDGARRRTSYADARKLYADEIDKVVVWAQAVGANAGLAPFPAE